ncbi:MAG: NADH-quinone oxidoreductase subunit NuoG [Rhizobiaceae bacterium]|nr:NADH-quinone oxidoreductase subunit NuoG [Rhizobiaceae bacterium]
MAKLVIDGNEIEVPDHYTVLQACEEAGAEIPRFCFHERLSIAGNCRMCLVEVKGGPPKPQASCALGVRDLRPGPDGEPPVVETKSPMVKKAREGVMEFLLINHPLDCPICDQGGECDLQDQAMAYGIDKNRFAENKRAVEDKYIGPLVRTKMTRCIHCTRCVRFTTEVAGISELGLTGRGEDAEITTYLETAMTSEMQGNVIDLCPVGALTSRPYQDSARSWELRKTESIDVMDAVGSNIRVDTRGREVMRIMPRLHEDVNEEWISDKSRFIWDGLKTQRLDRPYVRKNSKLQASSWDEALNAVAKAVSSAKPNKVGAIAGSMSGVEELFAMKGILSSIGSTNMDCRAPGSALNPENGRESYLFNATIAGIEESDALLIVGANPRFEAAVMNSRILKRVKMGNYPVGVIGDAGDLRYPYEDLGAKADVLNDLISGKNKFIAKLKKAKKPLIIIGQGALNRSDSADIIGLVAQLAADTKAVSRDWNGLSVLHTDAATVGGLDLGFVPGKSGKSTAEMLTSMDVLFLLGADEVDMQSVNGFTVYIGTHGDAGAHKADVILPASTYTEKSATFVNTEGRVQMTARAAFAPGEAKEDWAILRALSAKIGKTLPFDNLNQLRSALYAEFPHFATLDEVADSGVADVNGFIKSLGATKSGKVSAAPLTSPIKDFFMSNPIARASKVMAECSSMRSGSMKQAAE